MVPSLAFDRNKNQPTFNNQNPTNQPNQNPTNINNSTNQTLPKQQTTQPQNNTHPKPPTFHCTFHHLQLARLGFIHFGSRHTSGHNTADCETWRRSCGGGSIHPIHPHLAPSLRSVVYTRWAPSPVKKWPYK